MGAGDGRPEGWPEPAPGALGGKARPMSSCWQFKAQLQEESAPAPSCQPCQWGSALHPQGVSISLASAGPAHEGPAMPAGAATWASASSPAGGRAGPGWSRRVLRVKGPVAEPLPPGAAPLPGAVQPAAQLAQEGGALAAPVPDQPLRAPQLALQVLQAAVAELGPGASLLQRPRLPLQLAQPVVQPVEGQVPLGEAGRAAVAAGEVVLEAALAVVAALPREAGAAGTAPAETLALQALHPGRVAVTGCRSKGSTSQPRCNPCRSLHTAWHTSSRCVGGVLTL